LVVAKYPKAKFLFCGTGPQEEEIRSWVDDAGLHDHVVFTGWVDRDVVPTLYKCMDIYLHAAKLEPFGFIYPEAMMAGVPVVTTRTGAAADVIRNKVSGIFVNERSGVVLAESVLELLRSDMAAIGTAGKAEAMRRFSFEHMWQGYMEAYGKALGHMI